MRNISISGAILAVSLGLVSAGCQPKSAENTATNTTTNAAGHDMSNMGHEMKDGSMNRDMTDMSGHDMMKSDPGAATAPYDLQFIDSMIRHHEGAVIMAKMVLGKTQRAELKEFAQKILDDQTKEIANMKQMRERLFAGQPSAVNMEMPGMVGGMKIMTGEHMKEMEAMDAYHFDDHFLNMMTAHHEGAVTMAKETRAKAEHAEIKQLAEKIIKAQQPEIDQMKKWKATWENH